MKGYEKKVFFLKNTGSNIFEEAIFLVKGEGCVPSFDEGDMIVEANRIIEASLSSKAASSERERGLFFSKFLTPFFLGAIISAVIFTTLMLIF